MTDSQPPTSVEHSPEETPEKPLIDFPCDFMIKVIGDETRDFEDRVVSVFLAQGYSVEDLDLSTRASRQGRYVSVSVEFHVLNRIALETLYAELKKLENVKMLL